MIRLDPQQRAALSETFRELANLIAAVLVLGQLVGGRPLSWGLLVLGAVTWVGFVWLGIVFAGEER